MIRFGLCCIFRKEPVRFRAATARVFSRYPRDERLVRLSGLCRENSESLLSAVETVYRRGMGAFRVTSPLFPLYTHPEIGYSLDELTDVVEIRKMLGKVRSYCRKNDLRLSFHPDQFILLSSPRAQVVENSVRELRYQAMLAEQIGADVINIHGGGAYGDKVRALDRLRARFERLPSSVRKRLTLENDDVTYTPADLLPVCRDLEIPLVYDVHHHRCNPDGHSEEEMTEACLDSWQRAGREPYVHISSPREGWNSKNPKPHADYVNPADFPECWKSLGITVDVEAKAKELAVARLMDALKEPVVEGR